MFNAIVYITTTPHTLFNSPLIMFTKRIPILLTIILYSKTAFPQFTDSYENNIEGFSRLVIEGEPFAFFLKKGKWIFSDNKKNINVCWEKYGDNHKDQRSLVRSSIKESWEKYSPIRFTGWDKCNTNETGIRIKVENKRPQVVALGASISGRKNGMILNFNFNLDGYKSCMKEELYNLCIRTLAVHEFGHALGFAHEHNRKDAKDYGCMKSDDSAGDEELTPYDKDSVMNYCNPNLWKNFGKLSYHDVVALHEIYGKPKD